MLHFKHNCLYGNRTSLLFWCNLIAAASEGKHWYDIGQLEQLRGGRVRSRQTQPTRQTEGVSLHSFKTNYFYISVCALLYLSCRMYVSYPHALQGGATRCLSYVERIVWSRQPPLHFYVIVHIHKYIKY